MAIVPSGVSVPAQSKELDNTRVTTAYGLVYRQVITLADPETPTNYQRVGSNGAYVDVRNVVALPLPTGASTAALQTSGNASLTSIDTKLPSLDGGYVPVTIKNSSIEISNDAGNPVPVSGTFWQATQPVSGTFWQATQPVSFTRLSSGTDSVTVFQPTAANLNANVSGTVAATQSGTWNVTNVSGVVSLPTGASTAANQTTGNSSLSSIDTKTPALVTGRVPVDGSAVTQPISAASLPLPAGAATQATLSSIDAKFSALGQNTMSASTPVVLSSNHSDISVKNKSSSFSNITTTGTTTIKSGAGIFRRLVINTKGVSSNTFTIYDNTAGSGTVIATVDTVNSTGSLEYGLAFSTGLTIVSASGTSANATVIYE